MIWMFCLRTAIPPKLKQNCANKIMRYKLAHGNSKGKKTIKALAPPLPISLVMCPRYQDEPAIGTS